MDWVISGDQASVQAIVRLVKAVPSGRLVATATDRGTAFARFELPADMSEGALAELLLAARQKGLVGSPPEMGKACPLAVAEARGEQDASAVGWLGNAAMLRSIETRVSPREAFPFMLADGREGVAFWLSKQRDDGLRGLLQRAAAGEFKGMDVVLLTRPAPRN